MRIFTVLFALLLLAACADKEPTMPKPDCQPGVVTSDCPAQ